MRHILIIGFVGLLFFPFHTVRVQAQSNNVPLSKKSSLYWYMGASSYGMRIDRGGSQPEVLTNQNTTYGRGGSVVATDPTSGKLLFYSDGRRVYSSQHASVSTALNGDPDLPQGVAICRRPNNANQYYIFTHSGTGLSHSTYDVTTNTVSAINTAINAAVGQSIIVVAGANADEYRVYFQASANSTSLNIAHVTSRGITVATQSTGRAVGFTVKNMAYHPGKNRLFVVPINGAPFYLSVNRTTGSLTFLNAIVDPSSTPIVGSTWSPDGNKIYVSRSGGVNAMSDGIYQHDTQNPTQGYVLVERGHINHGLQAAPDGYIYVIYQENATTDPYLIGQLSNVNGPGNQVRFRENVRPQIVNIQGQHFPSFLPARVSPVRVDFDYAGTCLNAPIAFFPKTTPNADSVLWSVPNSRKKWSPIASYETNPGSVTMTAYYEGNSVSVTKPVTLTQNDLEIELVEDTIACSCELPNPTATGVARCNPSFSVPLKVTSGTASAIHWSNGDMGNTLTPDSAGYYYAVALSANGCSAYAGVTIKEYGQSFSYRNQWHFGNQAAIDFTEDRAQTSQITAVEGVNLACDKMGIPLFYTNGATVWGNNNDHSDYSQIATIGGNSDVTQLEIVPISAFENMYYIITPTPTAGGVYEMRYSIFDIRKLNRNGGIGDIVPLSNGELYGVLFTGATERVSKTNAFFLTHEFETATFRLYPYDSVGLQTPVINTIGSIHDTATPNYRKGQVKISQGFPVARTTQKRKVALALSNTGVENAIEVFDLDSIFHMSNYVRINLPNAGQVYGIEFSRQGSKVLASVRNGANSNIYEYAIANAGTAQVVPLQVQTHNIAQDIGSIEYAPDGQMYISVSGQTALGQINVSEVSGGAGAAFQPNPSNFIMQGKSLQAGTSAAIGLPTFSQAFSSSASFPDYINNPGCVGVGVTFEAQNNTSIDDIYWEGLSTTDNYADQQSVTITFNTARDYTVTLVTTNRCLSREGCAHLTLPASVTCEARAGTNYLDVEKTITINDNPPTPQVPSAKICLTNEVILNGNPNNIADLTFRWTNTQGTTVGETPNLTVRAAAILTLTVVNATTGCQSSQSGITVVDGRPRVTAGSDMSICTGAQVNLTAFSCTDASNCPNYTYQWAINRVPASTQRIINVNTQRAGEYTYRVTATVNDPDPNNRCVFSDSATISIFATPAVTLSSIRPTSCAVNNGSITLVVAEDTPPSAGTYTYLITGVKGSQHTRSNLTAPHTEQVTGLTHDIYRIVVSNSSDANNVCPFIRSEYSLLLDGFDFSHSIEDPKCAPVQITLNAVPSTAQFSRLTVTDRATGTDVVPSTGITGNTHTLSHRFNNGTYLFQVTDSRLGCTVDRLVDVSFPLTPQVAITQSCLELTARGASAYKWIANVPNSFTGSDATERLTMKPSAGYVTYSVTGTSNGCSSSTSVSLQVPPELNPVVTPSDPCQSQITLTASPQQSNFTYSWEKDGVRQTSLTDTRVTVREADDGSKWRVIISDPANNCVKSSLEAEAMIAGVFDVAVTSTTPCEGSPFTLTVETEATKSPVYEWSLNDIFISRVTSSQFEGTDNGVYSVKVVSRGCTKTSDPLEITKFPLSEAHLPSREIICDDPTNLDEETLRKTLDPGNVFRSYQWSKDGNDLSITTQTLTVTEPGLYQVALTDNNGCTASDKTRVIVFCEPKITGPNAFYPNSRESANQHFYIHSFFITEHFRIFIFNRWGEQVFRSSDRNFKWNGGHQNDLGKPLSEGMYAYKILYVSSYQREKGIQEKRGGVMLIR